MFDQQEIGHHLAAERPTCCPALVEDVGKVDVLRSYRVDRNGVPAAGLVGVSGTSFVACPADADDPDLAHLIFQVVQDVEHRPSPFFEESVCVRRSVTCIIFWLRSFKRGTYPSMAV